MSTHLERARVAIAEHHQRRAPQPHPQDVCLTELAEAQKALSDARGRFSAAVEEYRKLNAEFEKSSHPNTLELVRAAMLDAQEIRQELRLAEKRYQAAIRTSESLL